MVNRQKNISNYNLVMLILSGLMLVPFISSFYVFFRIFPLIQIIIGVLYLKENTNSKKTGTIMILIVSVIRLVGITSTFTFVVLELLTWVPLLIGFIFLCIERSSFKKIEHVSVQQTQVQTPIYKNVENDMKTSITENSNGEIPLKTEKPMAIQDDKVGINNKVVEKTYMVVYKEEVKMVEQVQYIAAKYDIPLRKIRRTVETSFQKEEA